MTTGPYASTVTSPAAGASIVDVDHGPGDAAWARIQRQPRWLKVSRSCDVSLRDACAVLTCVSLRFADPQAVGDIGWRHRVLGRYSDRDAGQGHSPRS